MATYEPRRDDKARVILAKHLDKAIEEIIEDDADFGVFSEMTIALMTDAVMVVLQTQADVNKYRDDNGQPLPARPQRAGGLKETP